ncbi:MAG: thiamine pyrophosphate-dependent enzyme [Rhodothermales bacterium]
MFGLNNQCIVDFDEEYHGIEEYESAVPRWCPGCGDNAILSSVQRLCRDEQLPPERTVFVSGIGCSSRFPHHMGTYGFHGLHGRALPVAEGVKIRRPDLHVFVNMGDGDCCSIGSAHWIHAIRYNMNLVAIVHDNEIYGMTKMQASPTTPQGLRTNTTPFGAKLKPLNILATTLGVTNASFVANVTDWMPESMYKILQMAFHHRGFSFVRVVQRCPHYLPHLLDPIVTDPNNTIMLLHEDGLDISDDLGKIYKNHLAHDPSDLNKAREIASMDDKVPVGILYRDPSVPCYDDLQKPRRQVTMEMRREALDKELNKFAVYEN